MSNIEIKASRKVVLSTFTFIISYSLLIASLILFNAFSGAEVFSSGALLYARSSLHFIPLSVFIALLILNKSNISIRNKNYFYFRIGIVFFMILFMLSSGINNGLEYDGFSRFMILTIHLLNLSVLLPLSINYIDINFSITKISKFYCWFLFFLSLSVMILYMSGGSIYNRLGYPYIPGVYAYMCLVALIVSIYILKSNMLGFFFMINIFMSGSRSALVLALLVYITSSFFSSSTKRIVVLLAITGSLMGAFSYFEDVSRPFLVEREDATSGRIEIWSEVVEVIKVSPLLGHNKKMTFGNDPEGNELAAHNSFLDLSIQYGVLFSFLAYFYWFSFVPNIIKYRNIRNNFFIAWPVFFVVTVKSLITNTFWTNMGDGVTYLVFVLITMIVMGTSYRVRQYG